jgi:hypothetical protein
LISEAPTKSAAEGLFSANSYWRLYSIRLPTVSYASFFQLIAVNGKNLEQLTYLYNILYTAVLSPIYNI